MTPQQAQDYIRKYQQVLAEDDRRGVRRDPTSLPTTKDNLMRAIKLEIAQLYFIGSASEELLEPLIRSAMFLDSFTHEPLDTVHFVDAMQRRRSELEGFHHQLLELKRDDAFFWQRVYALVGVNAETKSETIFETVKRKLGLGGTGSTGGGSTTVRRSEGRLVLD